MNRISRILQSGVIAMSLALPTTLFADVGQAERAAREYAAKGAGGAGESKGNAGETKSAGNHESVHEVNREGGQSREGRNTGGVADKPGPSKPDAPSKDAANKPGPSKPELTGNEAGTKSGPKEGAQRLDPDGRIKEFRQGSWQDFNRNNLEKPAGTPPDRTPGSDSKNPREGDQMKGPDGRVKEYRGGEWQDLNRNN